MLFSEELLANNRARYLVSVSHPFTNELCAGTLSDTALYVYLKQDLEFFLLGLRVFGKAIALCDSEAACVTLGKQMGLLCQAEHTYFHKSIGEIELQNRQKLIDECPLMLLSRPIIPEVQKYLDYLDHFRLNCTSYPEIVTFLYIMEKVYLDWTVYNEGVMSSNLSDKHKEWILLHSGDAFKLWVQFLEDEVNRVCVSETDKKLSEAVFARAIELEIAFFDACYNYSEV